MLCYSHERKEALALLWSPQSQSSDKSAAKW
jgi:hypothetical protein